LLCEVGRKSGFNSMKTRKALLDLMIDVKWPRRAHVQALSALNMALYCASATCHGLADTPPAGEPNSTAQSEVAARSVRPDPHPTDAEPQFREGLRLAAANKTEEAIKVFSGLIQNYPLLPQPYVQLAALYVHQGKLPKAVAALRAAVELSLDDGALQEQLGDLYLDLAAQSYHSALKTANPSATVADKYSALQKLDSRRAIGNGGAQR
jgi:tetratricopeptide (TPR) repeat protein